MSKPVLYIIVGQLPIEYADFMRYAPPNLFAVSQFAEVFEMSEREAERIVKQLVSQGIVQEFEKATEAVKS